MCIDSAEIDRVAQREGSAVAAALGFAGALPAGALDQVLGRVVEWVVLLVPQDRWQRVEGGNWVAQNRLGIIE